VTVIVHVERIPADGLNAYLWHRRLGATCRNGLAHSGYRHLADKDEVPGSSPGRPTTPASQVRALPSASAPARCRLGPRWGRTPIPAGTSPGPSGSAHPAVRLGDDHTAWSSTQPEDGSHAAAAATSRCSLPLVPTAQPPATGRAARRPGLPGRSAGKRGRRGPHHPAARVRHRPPTDQRDFGSVARVPASATVVEPSTARQPQGPPPVPMVRVARPPRPGPHRHRLSERRRTRPTDGADTRRLDTARGDTGQLDTGQLDSSRPTAGPSGRRPQVTGHRTAGQPDPGRQDRMGGHRLLDTGDRRRGVPAGRVDHGDDA
jgi:hypothetical protein